MSQCFFYIDHKMNISQKQLSYKFTVIPWVCLLKDIDFVRNDDIFAGM